MWLVVVRHWAPVFYWYDWVWDVPEDTCHVPLSTPHMKTVYSLHKMIILETAFLHSATCLTQKVCARCWLCQYGMYADVISRALDADWAGGDLQNHVNLHWWRRTVPAEMEDTEDIRDQIPSMYHGDSNTSQDFSWRTVLSYTSPSVR